MQPSRPYPSDLSDARWELIRPTLEAWRQARNGIRKPTHDLRALMNAILYVDRPGIPWRYLPHDFPPHQTVYGYFARWEADGIFDQLTLPVTRQSPPGRRPHQRTQRLPDRPPEHQDLRHRPTDQSRRRPGQEDIRCEERVKQRGSDRVLAWPGRPRLR